jgi:hypothetical protein
MVLCSAEAARDAGLCPQALIRINRNRRYSRDTGLAAPRRRKFPVVAAALGPALQAAG